MTFVQMGLPYGLRPFARLLACGSYGCAYALVFPTEKSALFAKEWLNRLGVSMEHFVTYSNDPVRTDRPIVIKITAPIKAHSTWDDFISRSLKENAIHLKIQKCKSRLNGATLCGKDIVPCLHFAGSVSNRFYSIMDKISGVELAEYMAAHQNLIPYTLFKSLEKAVRTLWMCGVTHNDLHYCNILVDVDKDGMPIIKIIDFGYAYNMTGIQRKNVSASLRKTGGDLLQAWSILEEDVNNVMSQRGIRYFSPEIITLIKLSRHVVDDSKLPAALWNLNPPLGKAVTSF
jgi:serine/threonine protein kinase